MQRMYRQKDDGSWTHMDFHPIDAREQKHHGWVDEGTYQIKAGKRLDPAPGDSKPEEKVPAPKPTSGVGVATPGGGIAGGPAVDDKTKK